MKKTGCLILVLLLGVIGARAEDKSSVRGNDGTSWQTRPIAVVGGQALPVFTSLGFTPGGRPAVAYFDPANKAVQYSELHGAAWKTTTIATDLVGDIGRLSLAFNHAGQPAISYYDSAYYEVRP